MLRVATRRTPLALAQTASVCRRLSLLVPGFSCIPVPLTTRGDELLESRLDPHGGKGLFIKELERALECGEADAAVHSLKDLPAVVADPFEIAAILRRDDPRDALVGATSLDELPAGAAVGTSSRRREGQLRRLRPDLDVRPLRGSVGRRLERLAVGECRALVLAAAGLWRLGLGDRLGELLPVDRFVPAIGQGALAVEIPRGDSRFRELWQRLHDPDTARCVHTERLFGRLLGADCTAPLAAHASQDDAGTIVLQARAVSADGQRVVEGQACGRDPEVLARDLAQRFLAAGVTSLFQGESS